MRGIILAVVLASSAIAGTTDDSIPDENYLRYAEGFEKFTRPIRVIEKDGRLATSTAVAIADRFALTAAHVVENAGTATVGGKEVARIAIHEEFEPGKFGWYDLAVVQMKDGFGLDFYPALSDGREQPGDVISIAGYGVTGRLSTGHNRMDGKLRAGTNTIDRFEKTLLVCPAARGGSPLPMCIAPGDSGGPIFVGSGVDARLCGISSFTMKDKGPLLSKEGEEMGATRIAYFREWIEKIVDRYESLDTVSPGSAPSNGVE